MISLALASALMVQPASTPVTLDSEPAALHGTLLRPEGELVAGAIIIPGSGPTDRDGNSPLGVRNGALKQLAEGLATQKIATVRIDKRGIAGSRAAGRSEAELSFDDMVNDAHAWASQSAQQLNLTCVWLIGHSEGALVAQAAAAKGDDKICGLILLAGAGRPAGVVIREQLTGLPEPLKTQAFDAVSEFEAGRTVPDAPPALAALMRPSVQPYMISWLKYDPAKLAAEYEGPTFIGHGTHDIQTTVADAQALKDARPNAELKLWEGVNHLFIAAPEERLANFATYGNPDAKIDPQVVEDVAIFILTNTVQ